MATKIEWTRGDDGMPGETWNPSTGCDDPGFSGGRVFEYPKGVRCAPFIREASNGAFRAGLTRPMRAGDRNGHGVMLDDDIIAVRVGKGRAGRELDGRTWDEFPRVTEMTGAV